jgi:hypothetical protein
MHRSIMGELKMTDGKLRIYDERTQEYTILDDGSSWGKIQTPKMKLEVKKMTHEENAEVGFEEWFNGNYGKFSCRSEWFYGDCEVKDEKIRKDLVYNWVRSAYLSGYEMGGALDELAHKTPQGTPDAL